MILVADPTRVTADLLCRRLRADGFEALAFATVPGLLGRAAAKDIEAIIVDPAFLVPKLRPLVPNVPILAFGTSDRAQDVAAAVAAGASAFLVKGRVTPTQLVTRLRELLAAATPGAPATQSRSIEGSYYVQIDPGFGDARRLGVDTGATAGMLCPECNGAMTLYLQRDISRWGKWLFGTFGCLLCSRRRRPPVSVQATPRTAELDELPLVVGGSR